MNESLRRAKPRVRLPNCRRCDGNLFLRELNPQAKAGEGIAEIACLQCGFVVPQPAADDLLREAVRQAIAA